MTPGPMDFLGALTALAAALPETGGYWLCLRLRIASGALGGSIVPEAPDTDEDILLCLVELLCRRNNDPARTGRVPFVPLLTAGTLPSVGSIASNGRFSGTIVCSPVGLASNWKSLAAVAILLARSSKLGDGRNSYEEVEFSSATPLTPNEKSEWLFWVEA